MTTSMSGRLSLSRATAAAAAVVLLAHGGAQAAPAPRLDPSAPSAAERAVFEACLLKAQGEAGAAAHCVTRVAEACAAQDGGETTAGMVICDARERALWTARIEVDTARLAARHSPGQRAALASAQTAFERWRAAKCAYAASLYEGGSLARVVEARCSLETTAAWSLDLARRVADEDGD
ncbi:MAG: DUF1311 domain-containing protein [Alphaproteobacteria bacterium]|nr:DUF1311 domain-containing protein [Alphaproteobacteria bacterium]